jgi:hypothetical protein
MTLTLKRHLRIGPFVYYFLRQVNAGGTHLNEENSL